MAKKKNYDSLDAFVKDLKSDIKDTLSKEVFDEVCDIELEHIQMEMPFWLKLNMTIKEAAAYSNIGINKIEELLKEPKCNFVLYVGNKKLVKRKEFEQYISKSLEV